MTAGETAQVVANMEVVHNILGSEAKVSDAPAMASKRELAIAA